MEQQQKIDLFLSVMETCIRTAWHNELGISPDDEENPDPDWDSPKLTFAMFSGIYYPDDETEMIFEIHDTLEEPMVSHPIKLHLSPENFGLDNDGNQFDIRVVTLDKPTPQAVFTAVEAYYRDLGCPPTDKRFVEMVMPLKRDSTTDYRIFMGS